MKAALAAPTTKAGRLQRVLANLYRDQRADGILKTNGRFVFYEVEHTGLVRKAKPGETRRLRGFPAGAQDLGDALFEVRKRGHVPWSWIEDETRTLYGTDYEDTIAQEVEAYLAEARTNPWDTTPPLILVESRSLGGVLRPMVLDEYRCRLAATNGQCGGFLRTNLAPILRDNERRVLYLGDLDHQGGQIEDNTRRVLEREAGREIDWRRIALTDEQVAEHDLQPIWKRDERYSPAREQWAWEAEALGQKTFMGLVRAELDALLPEPIEDVLERERDQRQRVAELLREGAS